MKKIALSIEQMFTLKELGIDINNASMHWQYLPTPDAIMNDTDELYEKPDLFVNTLVMKHEYPAFTLHDIMEILPGRILDKEERYQKDYLLRLIKNAEDKYRLVYYATGRSLNAVNSDNPLDCAYHMLIWAKTKGFV